MARVFAIDAPVASAEHASAGARLKAALQAQSAKLNIASRLWVGLSGGADSAALLLAVKDVFPEHDVRASHINHGVQTQAQAWAEQCAALCERLQIPIDVLELKPPANGRYPGGFEAWARSGRYQHWRGLLVPGDVLLLGHHAADQQETVVLKLLQGRLPIPMPVRRVLVTAKGSTADAGNSKSASRKSAYLLRPWIGLPGALTREFLTSAGESWIEDPSNESDTLLRNRVRHRLLPGLSGKGFAGSTRGGWPQAFDRCGALTQRMVQRFEASVYQNAPHKVLDGVGELARLPFSALDCPSAVHAWFSAAPVQSTVQSKVQSTAQSTPSAKGKPLSRAQIEGAIAGLKRQQAAGLGRANRQGSSLGNNLSLWLAESDLVLWREPNLPPSNFRLPKQGHLRIALGHGTLTVFGAAGSSIVVRSGTPGESVRGRPLREILRAAGVPRWARASYPIVCALDPKSGGVPLSEPTCIPRYHSPPDFGPEERLEAYFETPIESMFRQNKAT